MEPRALHSFPTRRSSDLASGYLLKKTPPAKILEALADVHAGGAPMSNAIARKLVEHFQQRPAVKETQKLSAREFEILGLLRSEEHTSELQSRRDLVCRLL